MIPPKRADRTADHQALQLVGEDVLPEATGPRPRPRGWTRSDPAPRAADQRALRATVNSATSAHAHDRDPQRALAVRPPAPDLKRRPRTGSGRRSRRRSRVMPKTPVRQRVLVAGADAATRTHLRRRDRHDREVLGAQAQRREAEQQAEQHRGAAMPTRMPSQSGPPWSTVIAVPYAPTIRNATCPKFEQPRVAELQVEPDGRERVGGRDRPEARCATSPGDTDADSISRPAPSARGSLAAG